MAFGKELRTWLMRRMTPFVVLTISLVSTALITFYVFQTSANRDEARFQSLVLQMEEEVVGRISIYRTILSATKGFIHSNSPPLTRQEFAEFVSVFDLRQKYPGIQGVGYTVRVPRERVPNLEVFGRSQGYENFRVWPETSEPNAHSILFLEPLDKRNAAAIGFNMASHPVRREAMERAAATGTPALSGPVTLVQEIEGRKQAGFLYYMPVYSGEPVNQAQREAQLVGYTYIPVRADDFLAAIVGRRQIHDIGLRIYDGDVATPESLLHSDPERETLGRREPRFRDRRTLFVGGRRWTIEYWSRQGFESASPRNFTSLAAMVGLLVSLILFFLARMLFGAWLRAAEQSEDLRDSQAALATRERQLDTLLSNTPDIIARFDRNLRHVYVNAAVERATGLKPEAFLGKTNAELGMPQALVDIWDRVHRRVFETGEPTTHEFEFPGPNGIGYYQARIVPERNPAGRVETILLVTRDISELKHAEARLRTAARNSALLADSAQAFVEARLDESAVAEGAVRVLTEKLGEVAAIFRYDAEQDSIIILALRHRDTRSAKQFFDLPIGVPLPRDSTKVIARVLETGVAAFIQEEELVANTPGIPEVYAEKIRSLGLKSLMVLPLKAEGASQGALAFASRAQLSFEDFETVSELTNRAALALENARLYQEARRAVRLRDEFLSIASHELKTPLTPLQLQMESLERLVKRNEPISPERLASVARITVRQVQRLTSLVANLLDISRISEGRLALEPEPCDLGAIVDETVERFALEAERIGSVITVKKEGALGGLWDRMRMEQVVTNLVSNALKYGAGKPVEVHVTQQGASVELRVVDYGIGVAPEFLPMMFKRFSRGVSGRSYGGLGLGLFIVHEIVTGHGGTVEARSNAGATEVRVLLPASPEGGL